MWLTHNINGEKLTLLPDRAIYWASQEILLISDLHLGKIDHFRKWGIGLPAHASLDNFNRLQKLILAYPKVKRIIFLGDLFHSDMNEDWSRFLEFINTYATISFELVMGNHDVFDSDVYTKDLDQVYPDSVTINGLILSHEPLIPNDRTYNLCGHIHPGYVLRGKGRQRLRLPCFHFSPTTGILPAFGTFTGLHVMEANDKDDVFVIAENEIIRV